MYWEALGFKDSPASTDVEDVAKWLQWALTGATDPDQEKAVRYNLDQFWKAKASVYYSQSPIGKQQLEKLDTLAHGIWQALESREVYRQGPNFGAWLVNTLGNGLWEPIGLADRAAAAARVDAARAGAAAAAARAGQAGMVDYFKNRTLSGSQLAKDASSIDASAKGPLGISWMVWGVGAAVIIGALMLRD